MAHLLYCDYPISRPSLEVSPISFRLEGNGIKRNSMLSLSFFSFNVFSCVGFYFH